MLVEDKRSEDAVQSSDFHISHLHHNISDMVSLRPGQQESTPPPSRTFVRTYENYENCSVQDLVQIDEEFV